MKALKLASLAVAVAVFGMVGCDQSKAELDKTKAQMMTVTSDRDALKGQVTNLTTQVQTITQQLNDANAKLTATQGAQQAADDAAAQQKQAAGHSASVKKTEIKRETVKKNTGGSSTDR